MPIASVPCASHKGYKYFLYLDGELEAANCLEIQSKLCKMLNKKGGIIIDGESVSSIDAVGVQLLCAFINDLKKQDRPILIENISQQMDDTALALGVDLIKICKSFKKGGDDDNI